MSTRPSKQANPSKKLILLVANTSWYLLNFKANLIAALRDDGWDVHLAAPDADFRAELETHGAVVHCIRMQRRSKSPLSLAATFASLFSLYFRLQPTIVHHFTIKPVILGGIAARLTRIPAIVQSVTGLGHAFGSSRLLSRIALLGYRFALGGRAFTIVQNPDDGELLVNNRVARRERMALIPGSGVDPAEFTPSQSTPIAHPPTFLMCCRMLKSKGVSEYVAASDDVVRRLADAQFLLLGPVDDGSPDCVSESWLREACSSRPHLKWLGFQRDIRQIMAAADVVVLPSYREGVPRTLIEGAMMAKPLVATDVPGCREIVRNDISGIAIPPRDSAALADALLRLAQDVALRRALGDGARDIAIKEFRSEVIVDKTLACYRRALTLA